MAQNHHVRTMTVRSHLLSDTRKKSPENAEPLSLHANFWENLTTAEKLPGQKGANQNLWSSYVLKFLRNCHGTPNIKARQQSGTPNIKARQQSGTPNIKARQQSGTPTQWHAKHLGTPTKWHA